jgi:hypothetical protein
VGRRELVELGGTEEEPEKLVNWGSGGGGRRREVEAEERGGGESGGTSGTGEWRNWSFRTLDLLVLPTC